MVGNGARTKIHRGQGEGAETLASYHPAYGHVAEGISGTEGRLITIHLRLKSQRGRPLPALASQSSPSLYGPLQSRRSRNARPHGPSRSASSARVTSPLASSGVRTVDPGHGTVRSPAASPRHWWWRKGIRNRSGDEDRRRRRQQHEGRRPPIRRCTGNSAEHWQRRLDPIRVCRIRWGMPHQQQIPQRSRSSGPELLHQTLPDSVPRESDEGRLDFRLVGRAGQRGLRGTLEPDPLFRKALRGASVEFRHLRDWEERELNRMATCDASSARSVPIPRGRGPNYGQKQSKTPLPLRRQKAWIPIRPDAGTLNMAAHVA